MNIFYLDTDIIKCAQSHCDKHCGKMIVETSQMLSTVVRLTGVEAGTKSFNPKHPCNLWAFKSLDNWLWLRDLGKSLGIEYFYRFGKYHKSLNVILSLPEPNIPRLGITDRPKAMPDVYKSDSVLESYRNYYKYDKVRFAKWTKRDTPKWMLT